MFKVRLSPMQRSQTAKKILLASFLAVFLLLILPHVGLAQAPENRFGLVDAQGIGLPENDLRVAIVRIVQIILGFLGIIAVLIVLYGGFIWMTSGGDPTKIEKAKKILINAVIGIIVILSSFIIVSFIINALKGAGGTPGGGPGGGGPDDGGRWGIGVGPIESVSPRAGQINTPISAAISVTFKEFVNPETICSDANCDGDPMTNIAICQVDTLGICVEEEEEFDSSEFVGSPVFSSDNKTFTIVPTKTLGLEDFQNRKFKVTLESGIETSAEPGRSVFTSLVGQEFAWQFTTNGEMDLDPPEVLNITGVYPYPDEEVDIYGISAEPTPTQFDGDIVPNNIVDEKSSSFDAVPAVTTPGSPEASITGNYGGTGSGLVSVVISGGGNVTANWPGGMGQFTSQYSGGSLINIGPYGLSFNLAGAAEDGNSWTFNVSARVTGDRMEVLEDGSVISTYVFGEDIAVPDDYMNVIVAGDNIFSSCGIGCLQTNDTGADSARYDIRHVGAGTLTIIKTNGSDTVGNREQQGAYDAYRNTIIAINFTEPINPTSIDGNIIVRRDGVPISDYTLEISNQYRTIELLASQECGQNSCGESMFCWPVDGNAQNYEVEIVAGSLIGGSDPKCQQWGGVGDGNNRCVKNVGGVDVFYPLSPLGDGLTDMSLNAFNGSFDTYTDGSRTSGIAQGQSSTVSGRPGYHLNAGIECVDGSGDPIGCWDTGAKVVTYGESTPVNGGGGYGDNFLWSFYMSSEIDDQAPIITTVSPVGDADVSSASEEISVSFDRVMRSSTLRPGWNYGNSEREKSQRHLVLQTISETALPIGYWVVKQDIDNNFDGWADISVAEISHHNFDSFIKYGPLVGSGVQSATQNCFLPGAGPLEAAKDGQECQYIGDDLSGDCANVQSDNPASYGYLNCTEIDSATECSDSCQVLYYDEDDESTHLDGSWVLTKDHPTALGDGSTGCCLGTCVAL
jgi:hypothetical protein